MSENTNSIDVSEETWERLQELREPDESMSETVERLLEITQDERVLYSAFTVVALIGALTWVLSYALFGETVSNMVAGLFISLTLFWLSWRELAFRGIVGSSDDD